MNTSCMARRKACTFIRIYWLYWPELPGVSRMDNDNTQKKFLIGIALKLMIVIGIGTALAFWHLSRL